MSVAIVMGSDSDLPVMRQAGEALDLFGMFSWAAAALFVQALKAAGRNPTRADPAPARPKARTLGARRHVAHGGPGASPRGHAKPSDQ